MSRILITRLSFILLCLSLTAAGPNELRLHRGLNYFEVLGLSEGFAPDQLKSAFRKAMKRVHPDRGGTVEDAQFVIEAYRTLSDPAEAKLLLERLKRTSPQSSALEQRRQNLSRITKEVHLMAELNFSENPNAPVKDLTARAIDIILYHAQFFEGQMAEVPELVDLMENGVLANRFEASIGARFILASGVIDLLKRLGPEGYSVGDQARQYLHRLSLELASDIRGSADLSYRQFLDRVFEKITGRSVLRAPLPPSPPPSVGPCEAALRYLQASELGMDVPARVDIRF